MEAHQKMHAVAAEQRAPSRDAIVSAANRAFSRARFRGRQVWTTSPQRREWRGARSIISSRARRKMFREMLQRMSAQLGHAYPPGFETQGDVGQVLRTVVRMTIELHQESRIRRFPAYGCGSTPANSPGSRMRLRP